MADFAPIFDHILKVEGGLKLINVPGDRGGMTFAGISRRAHPGWPGWAAIDAGNMVGRAAVQAFYIEEYWAPISGRSIRDPDVAEVLMSSAVLSGKRRAVKMAQACVEATVDGFMGPNTLEAINAMDPHLFDARFALARLNRFRKICNHNRGAVEVLARLDESDVRRTGDGPMSWLSKLVGGGVGEVAGALGSAAKDIEDVFTTSDREQLDQYRAETERLTVQQAASQGQLAVNAAEAAHPSVFVAGWRSSIGWVCSAAMAYHFILLPIGGPFLEKYTGVSLLDVSWQELSVVLMGMLGMAGVRTYEKVKGVARERLKPKK